MSFWSSEKLIRENNYRKERKQKELIYPFACEFVQHGAYELSLGPEGFITTDPKGTKQKLESGAQLVIPPGQFGLLLTEETVAIPQNAIAFISIRFSIKQRGLVNVSGFHVDPGFTGRLKFAVYNAGSQNIILSQGERIFMIWFSELTDDTKDGYDGDHANQAEITSEDVMRLQGEVASPAALKKQIDVLRSEYDLRFNVLDHEVKTWSAIVIGLVITVVGGLLVGLYLLFFQGPARPQTLSPESVQPPATVQEPNRNTPATEGSNNPSSKPSNASGSKPESTK